MRTQIRTAEGKLVPVGRDCAVEILDSEGRLAITVVPVKDGLRILTAGDPLFNAFCRSHGLRPSSVVVHEQPAGRTMGG